MDAPRDHYTKGSKSDKDKYHITYMWNLKKDDTMNLLTKKVGFTDMENKLMVTKGER